MIEVKYQHLIGKPFIHGSDDCYGIARHFYKDNWGIELTNYARPDRWWDAGMNLYNDHFYEEGFRLVDDPVHKVRIGDALLVAVRSAVPNHLGIYLGEGQVLHHFYGQISKTTELKGIFRNNLCAMIRHPSVVLDETPTTLDMMDFLSPEKRRLLEQVLSDRSKQETVSEGP